MIPANYQCEGQLNLWDYLKEEEPKEPDDLEFTPCWDPSDLNNEFPPLDPDLASGKRKPYEYDFCRGKGMLVDFYPGDGSVRIGTITDYDDYYTFIDVDGEEFVGTTHNVAYHEGQLPSMEECLEEIKNAHLIYCFEPVLNDIHTGYEYNYRWSHSKMNIHESHYSEGIFGGRRYISVSWDCSTGGFSTPCDTLAQVLRRVGEAIDAAEKLEFSKLKKKKETDGT